ncbi:hypothetical protein SKAU_G00121840 [Synaphobranchus kaupii]|uniref:Uncharacterized protein n=1 Tax=Synaphobranchus kaupii TaxID=118154 RepID=A0A9Q1FPH7_SYNKA|nr:hypothetical protein SKAU_G00121840 [Synaphobranchus kaupii]
MEQWWWKTDKRMGLRKAANITEGEAAAGASTSRETTADPPAKKTKCIFPREWLEATNMVSDFAARGLHHQIPEELESYGNEKVDFLIETYGSYVALLKETGVSGEIPLWEDREALQDHSRPS